eukprot:TRINITY_DN4596_c0_g1_i2.p1 TRINITY_DN4596_c0_g1~~TRINITY_DN4596_c0_g1_i2.p1  ORF type:complete len:377 (+),score=54.22 TRINITY_DN4596_c0_g1_i2:63-1193(+)
MPFSVTGRSCRFNFRLASLCWLPIGSHTTIAPIETQATPPSLSGAKSTTLAIAEVESIRNSSGAVMPLIGAILRTNCTVQDFPEAFANLWHCSGADISGSVSCWASCKGGASGSSYAVIHCGGVNSTNASMDASGWKVLASCVDKQTDSVAQIDNSSIGQTGLIGLLVLGLTGFAAFILFCFCSICGSEKIAPSLQCEDPPIQFAGCGASGRPQHSLTPQKSNAEHESADTQRTVVRSGKLPSSIVYPSLLRSGLQQKKTSITPEAIMDAAAPEAPPTELSLDAPSLQQVEIEALQPGSAIKALAPPPSLLTEHPKPPPLPEGLDMHRHHLCLKGGLLPPRPKMDWQKLLTPTVRSRDIRRNETAVPWQCDPHELV